MPGLNSGDPHFLCPACPSSLGLGSGLWSDGAVPPRGREGLLAHLPSRGLQFLHREGRSRGGWDPLPPRHSGHLCQRRVQGAGASRRRQGRRVAAGGRRLPNTPSPTTALPSTWAATASWAPTCGKTSAACAEVTGVPARPSRGSSAQPCLGLVRDPSFPPILPYLAAGGTAHPRRSRSGAPGHSQELAWALEPKPSQ